VKLRRLINLPVFDEHTAQIVGRVLKAVIGDDFRLSYLVIESPQGYGILRRQDLQLGNDAVCIKNIRSIKPYNNREELSIYNRKIGDTVYDHTGRELGIVSDFVLAPDVYQIRGVELSRGAIKDMLNGRSEVELNSISWKSPLTAVASLEGSELNDN